MPVSSGISHSSFCHIQEILVNCFCGGIILEIRDAKLSETWLLPLLTSKYITCILRLWTHEESRAWLLSESATWLCCVGIQMGPGEVLCCWVMLWEASCWCRDFLWSAHLYHFHVSERMEPQTWRVSLCQLIHPERSNSKIWYEMRHLEVHSFSVHSPQCNKRAFWRPKGFMAVVSGKVRT